MLKNYIITAVRTLLKNKGFQFLNILGLSIGMAAFILIGLYIQYELSFDSYHEKSDRIYRLVENLKTDGDIKFQATTATPMGPTLADEFPEVEEFVRFIPDGLDSYIVRKDGKSYDENSCYLVDASVFRVFSWPLVNGEKETALANPYSVVLTRSTARKYFADAEPLGQTLDINHENFIITGVMEDLPENSHFNFDLLISMSTMLTNKKWEYSTWGYNAFYTYILLADGKDMAKKLSAKIPAYMKKYISDYEKEYNQSYSDLPLQPLTSIYLDSPRIWENGKRGSQRNIFILSAVALFILLIASFNYINLTTALASRRLKEVGLRKTFGASRSNLIAQFLSESIIICIVSVAIGVGFASLVLPWFKDLTDAPLKFDIVNQPEIWISLITGSVVLGVVAGIYPAFFASGFSPLHVSKGDTHTAFSKQWLRKILVSAQFIISIVLLAGTLSISMQMNFIRTIDLGFEKERMLVLKIEDNQKSTQLEYLKNKLRSVSGVKSLSASNDVPGDVLGNSYVLIERQNGTMTESNINILTVDYDFLTNYEIKSATGRFFSHDFPADDSTTFIMNESAVHFFGWPTSEAAIGKRIDLQGRKGTVIGVVKDFYYKSLHSPIEPLLLYIDTDFSRLSMQMQIGADIAMSMKAIENEWKTYSDLPFIYSFLDQDFDRLHNSDEQLGKFVTLFSGLAMFIACLGLVGLTSFIVQKRSKEIGVRKILGASVAQVITNISKEFIWLIFLSFCISVPIIYLAVNEWLQQFSNHITLGPGIFAIAGISVLVIAWLTIFIFSFRTANTHPADVLRSE